MLKSYEEYAARMPPEAWAGYSDNLRDVQGRWEEASTIVSELGGSLAGTVTLYLENSYNEAWPKDWAGIRLLGTHPSARGKGVGKLLMDECIRRSREYGMTHIGLHTTILMDTARKMYERTGFIRTLEYDFQVGSGVLISGYVLDLTSSS